MSINLSNKTYRWIGISIQLMQLCDNALKTVLLLAFPGVEAQDREIYLVNEKRLDRATLGRLISVLRQRVVLTDEFSKQLETYLQDRNALIHNWDDIEAFKEKKAALNYVQCFALQAIELIKIFASFIREWQKQVGVVNQDGEEVSVEEQEELDEFLQELDENYGAYIDDFLVENKNC